jgi:Bifunctional DNA primase/polymerase, N-terminal
MARKNEAEMYGNNPEAPATPVTATPVASAPLQTKSEILLAAAESCLAEGWAIIPLTPGGKTPLPAWLNEQGHVRRWQNGVHSVYSASFGPVREYICPKSGKTLKTTPALQAWWDGLESNPAIALELSGLTALDIDEGIGDENELLEFLSEFHIPITRAVRSGRTSSFGVHLLYTGVTDSGSFAIEWHGKIVKGEVKSRDKYVAAEGSFHKSGNQYTRLWNTVMTATPVALFTAILKNHAPAKSAVTVIPDAAFEGSSVTPEQFETWAEKNGENFTFAGFHEGKQASMYTRDAGCPWIEKHTTTKPNEDSDFAIFVPINGKMSAVCVHESCKSEWTQPSCWKSYRAWLEAKNGSIQMQPTGKVYVGKPTGDFPNGSGVSGDKMPETPTNKECESAVADKSKKFDIGEFSRPAVHGGIKDYVLKPLPGVYDGWFPRGDSSAIGGSSGSGKTTLMIELLRAQHAKEIVFGHEAYGLEYLILMADRGKKATLRTFDRMGIDPKSIPIETLRGVGQTALVNIKKRIEAREKIPAVVFVEGADMIVPENTMEVVAPFLDELQKMAEHYHIAFVLSLGTPKLKAGDGYVAKRDNLFGTVAWGRKLEAIILMQYPNGDDTVATREMCVLLRQSPPEKFHLIFKNGILVENAFVQQHVEPVHDFAMMQSGWFSVEDVSVALSGAVNHKTIRKRLEDMHDTKLLKRKKGDKGKFFYALNIGGTQ